MGTKTLAQYKAEVLEGYNNDIPKVELSQLIVDNANKDLPISEFIELSQYINNVYSGNIVEN